MALSAPTNNYYQTLLPTLNVLEQERIDLKERRVIYVFCTVVSMLTFLILTIIVSAWFIIPFFFCFAYGTSKSLEPATSFSNKFKDVIVPKIIANIDQSLQFSKDCSFPVDQVLGTGLFVGYTDNPNYETNYNPLGL